MKSVRYMIGAVLGLSLYYCIFRCGADSLSTRIAYVGQTNSTVQVQVLTTNTVPNNLYVGEAAIDLAGPWYQYTDSWTNDVTGEHVDDAFVGGSSVAFFRTRDITLQWVSVPVNRNQPGASVCGGNFQSSALFWTQGTNWGYPIDPNTTVHKVAVVGHPNVHILADALAGGTQCGVGELTLVGDFTQYHFIICYDGDPGPTCTVIFTGFKSFDP